MKKFIAIMTAACITLPQILVANATMKADNVVTSFESLMGFENLNDGSDTRMPNGWEMFKNYAPFGTNVDSVTESNGTTVMQLKSGCRPAFYFDETLMTGTLHLSFDAKYNGGDLTLYGVPNTINNNPRDIYGTTKGELNNPYFYLRENYCTILSNPLAWTEGTALEVNDNTGYNKYDFLFDFNAGTYVAYRDGVQIGDAYPIGTNLKAIDFSGDGFIDNLYLNHFKSTEDIVIDPIKVTTDYHGNEDECLVNVAFSEYIELVASPTFKVTSTATGEEVDVSKNVDVYESAVSGYDFTFYDLPTGEYEISFEGLTGALSGQDVTETAKFTVGGKAADLTAKRYYVDEDFEGYAGGMPAGWQRGIIQLKSDWNEANRPLTSVTDSNGGKAMELSLATTASVAVGNSVSYQFPSDIYSGCFTVEFDAKVQAGTAWNMGLLTAAEYESWEYTWNKDANNWQWAAQDLTAAADWQKRDDLDKRLNQSKVIGATSPTTYYSTLGQWNDPSTYYSGITTTADEWTHIKVDVNLNKGTYTFTAPDGTTKEVSYNPYRFEKRLLQHADGTTLYKYGIAGIRFCLDPASGTENKLAVDNIKVYTDKAYNGYDSFDNLTEGNQLVRQFNYSAANYMTDADNTHTYAQAGKNDTTALHLTAANGTLSDGSPNTGNQYFINYRLAKPIKAGNSFEIEFDLKPGAQKAFALSPVVESKMYANDSNLYNSKLLTTLSMNDAGNRYFSLFDGGWGWDNAEIAATDADGNYICFEEGKWHHIKLAVTHNADGTSDVTLNVTDETGTVKTMEVKGNARIAQRYRGLDISALQFSNQGAYWQKEGMELTIDNLKVTETEPTAAPEVMTFKTVNYDGTTDILEAGAKVPANVKSIAVSFNAALASADGIKAYYADRASMSNANAIAVTTTLSDDKHTAYITFPSDVALNENIVIEASNKIQFADSYLSTLNTESKTFTFVEANGEVELTDFRMYEWIEGRTLEGVGSCEGAWVPVTSMEGKSTEQVKLVVTGYNTKKDAQIQIIGADYTADENGARFNTATQSVLTLGLGAFNQELTGLELSETGNLYKGFLWSYPQMKPFTVNLEYTK